MPDPTFALRLQMLAWISEKPRTYREVMDAWRTSCPRLTIWEDAVDDGLVEVRPEGRMESAAIVVTDQGRLLLARAQADSTAL
jgi:hypothetical protein